MARTCLVSDYFTAGTAPAVTAAPFTVNGWFKPTNLTGSMVLWCSFDSGGSTHHFNLQVRGDLGDDVLWTLFDGSFKLAQATTSFVTDIWQMATGIEASSTDRRAFIDGGSKGTNATSATPTSIDSTRVGQRGPGSETDQTGDIAEVAVWNVALSDAEVAALYNAGPLAYSPFFVRPDALVHYYRMIEDSDSADIEDIVGGLSLTQVSTPVVADHVPVLYPAPKPIWSIPAAADGGTILPQMIQHGLYAGSR